MFKNVGGNSQFPLLNITRFFRINFTCTLSKFKRNIEEKIANKMEIVVCGLNIYRPDYIYIRYIDV